MRLVARRAVCRRGFVYVAAIVFCLGPTLAGVRAQDAQQTGGPAAIASTGETVLLREHPGYDAAALATLADGSALDVTGELIMAADGTAWVPVVAGGQSGYVPAGYVGAATTSTAEPPPETSSAPPASTETTASEPGAAPLPGVPATTTTDANLRSGPSMDAEVLLVLPPGTAISVEGELENGFVPVTGNGVSGWVAVDLLAEGTAPASPSPAPDPNTPFDATAMSDANLRAAPDRSSTVLSVVPAGSALRTTGGPQNGYFPVDYAGQVGWIEGELLSIEGGGTTTITPATVDVSTPVPATTTASESPEDAQRAARGESTGIIWPFAGGEWEVVQGYNNGTHTNRGAFAQYQYSLDWARVDGNTAGQPVTAPVSGTVRWVDRGSGGMLVDAGNGYGVAVFHVTIDRNLGRGDRVERGQRIGTISGPGGEGYMSMPHIDITCWRLTDGGHEATPFVGPNAIAGQEFPDTGGANQHMGARVAP